MTDPSRWRRIEAVFADAADLDPADRPAFLDGACRTADGRLDAALREEVEALLAADVAATLFFEGADAQLGAVVGDAVEATEGSQVPERVGPWRLVERVGRGGMGEVWRAERADGAFEQTAAVKLVRPGLADDVAGRFRAERQILAGLDHANVARLLGGGRADDGRPWLAMEFVEGEPLTAYCDRRRLGINERLALFGTVCDAVAYAHRSLVVHRDLKPSNVLVADDGAVKLLDFGIAKLLDADADEPATRTGRMLLTPEYAAPEQVTGGPITTATDVYALGALLYELLTGRRAVRVNGRGAAAVERAVLEAEPTRPSDAVTTSAPTGGRVPPTRPASSDGPAGDDETAPLRSTTTERLRRRLRGDLDRIVMKALRKEPDRRYESAAALGADVRRHLDGLPVEARPDTAGYRVGKFVRRHRAGVAAGALALLAVVGGAGVAVWQAAEARAAQAEAEAAAAFVLDLVRSPDPWADTEDALGPDATLVDFFDAAVRQSRDRLAGRPALRADLLHSVAEVFGRLGDHGRSRAAAQEALALRDSLFGRESEEAVEALGRYATTFDASAPDSALALHREHVALARRVHGDGPGLILPLNNLGFFHHHHRGGPDAASAPLEEAVALGRRAARKTEEDEDEWATALSNLASVRQDQDRLDDAWALEREALAVRRRVHGPDALDTVYSLAELGDIAGDRGDTDLAIRHIGDAQRVLDLRLDPLHGSVLANLNNYATVLQDAERYDEAEPLFRDLLDRRRRRYGPDDAETASGLNNLAVLLSRTGRVGEARPLYDEALRVYRAALPEGHYLPGFVLLSIAQDDLTEGRDREAEARSREARALLLRTFPPEHLAVAIADQRIGRALAGQGRQREAEPYLVRAYRHLTARGVVQEDTYTRQTRDALVALYRATGRAAEADALRAEGPPAE